MTRTRTRSGAVPESSPSGPPPLDLVVFTVIVDDLVFADGATRMGGLGGVYGSALNFIP